MRIHIVSIDSLLSPGPKPEPGSCFFCYRDGLVQYCERSQYRLAVKPPFRQHVDLYTFQDALTYQWLRDRTPPWIDPDAWPYAHAEELDDDQIELIRTVAKTQPVSPGGTKSEEDQATVH